MKASLIVPVIFLITFVINLIFGSGVESWWSFLFGIVFALSARDVGEELLRFVERR